jgi:hypothetical protein
MRLFGRSLGVADMASDITLNGWGLWLFLILR